MKIKKIVLFILTCLLIWVGVTEVALAKETDNNGVEIVVLIDTSLSIGDEQKAKEIEWAQEICQNYLNTGSWISFYTFDDPPEIGKSPVAILLDKREITPENLAESMEALSRISHNGNYTDLRGAMKEAVSCLESGHADKQYIILLSDGKLDYDNQDEYDLTGTEAEARKEFCDITREFAARKSGNVMLVDFGNSAQRGKDAEWMKLGDSRFEKNINLFDEISVDDGIEVFDREDALDKASEKLFDTSGFPIKTIKEGESTDGNRIQFSLDEDYSYIKIKVVCSDTLEEMNFGKEDFQVIYKGKKWPSNLIGPPYNNSTFIVLYSARKGKYEIILPNNGIWRYQIDAMTRKQLGKIEVMVIDDNGREALRSDDIYTIEAGKGSLYVKIDKKAENSGKLAYQIARNGGDFENSQKLEWGDYEDDGATIYTIPELSEVGEYILQVSSAGSFGTVYSDAIVIHVDERAEEISETETESVVPDETDELTDEIADGQLETGFLAWLRSLIETIFAFFRRE